MVSQNTKPFGQIAAKIVVAFKSVELQRTIFS